MKTLFKDLMPLDMSSREDRRDTPSPFLKIEGLDSRDHRKTSADDFGLRTFSKTMVEIEMVDSPLKCPRDIERDS